MCAVQYYRCRRWLRNRSDSNQFLLACCSNASQCCWVSTQQDNHRRGTAEGRNSLSMVSPKKNLEADAIGSSVSCCCWPLQTRRDRPDPPAPPAPPAPPPPPACSEGNGAVCCSTAAAAQCVEGGPLPERPLPSHLPEICGDFITSGSSWQLLHDGRWHDGGSRHSVFSDVHTAGTMGQLLELTDQPEGFRMRAQMLRSSSTPPAAVILSKLSTLAIPHASPLAARTCGSGPLLAHLVSAGPMSHRGLSNPHPLEVDLLEEVGRGTAHSVWKGLWQDAPVVVKLMVSCSKQQLHWAHTEASLRHLLSHPNVLQTFAYKITSLTEGILATPAPAQHECGAAAERPPTVEDLVSGDGFGAPHPAQKGSSALQTVDLACALRQMMLDITTSHTDMYLTQVGGVGRGDAGKGWSGTGGSGVGQGGFSSGEGQGGAGEGRVRSGGVGQGGVGEVG